MLHNKYIKNPNIKFRIEDEKAILFNIQTRRVTILAKELFEAWNNSDLFYRRCAEGSLTSSSYRTIIDRFLRDGLIMIKGDKYV